MKRTTSSPWIHQLKLERLHQKITQDFSTDIAIIGAGIAGVSTAYFVLKHTKKKVSLIEAYKVAHGATGHNAGQIVSYFEHPFANLVDQYGLNPAARAQEEIYYTWDTLEEIFKEANLKTPLHIFTGYAGCSSVDQINYHLRNVYFQRKAGLDIEGVLVANTPEITSQIPEEFSQLYARVDQAYILKLLETNDPRYIGALASKKGCLNSALFCEELLEVMISRYPDRFAVYEQSPVDSITLFKKEGKLHIASNTVTAERIVLCTNGFENFTIQNSVGDDINKRFHDTVIGTIGYMAAYLEPVGNKPVALSYFSSPSTDEQEPYFYFTRRPFEHKEKGSHTLISIGGPEQNFPDRSYYEREHLKYPKKSEQEIDEFIHQTYDKAPKNKIDYAFRWHGLMGYTPTKLRVIGPEPRNPVLMYNLGCNGVGILSSIYGGKRIGDWLKFGKMEKSIFDPQN